MDWETQAQHILLEHVRRYPRMQLQDLYKLIYQAAFGCEHVVQSPCMALRRLKHEWAHMGEGPAEPLCDVISPDGQLLRIHLRPYAARGGSLLRLYQAFLQTARCYRGSCEAAALLARCAIVLAEEERLPWAANELREFLVRCQERRWPSVHHSLAYRQAYCPAYRVVAVRYWDSCHP